MVFVRPLPKTGLASFDPPTRGGFKGCVALAQRLDQTNGYSAPPAEQRSGLNPPLEGGSKGRSPFGLGVASAAPKRSWPSDGLIWGARRIPSPLRGGLGWGSIRKIRVRRQWFRLPGAALSATECDVARLRRWAPSQPSPASGRGLFGGAFGGRCHPRGRLSSPSPATRGRDGEGANCRDRSS
jgi:hypothetical protein